MRSCGFRNGIGVEVTYADAVPINAWAHWRSAKKAISARRASAVGGFFSAPLPLASVTSELALPLPGGPTQSTRDDAYTDLSQPPFLLTA